MAGVGSAFCRARAGASLHSRNLSWADLTWAGAAVHIIHRTRHTLWVSRQPRQINRRFSLRCLDMLGGATLYWCASRSKVGQCDFICVSACGGGADHLGDGEHKSMHSLIPTADPIVSIRLPCPREISLAQSSSVSGAHWRLALLSATRLLNSHTLGFALQFYWYHTDEVNCEAQGNPRGLPCLSAQFLGETRAIA